jgi:hypothetical protein
VNGFASAHRRLVAVSLLVAVLAVFGMGTSANAQTPQDPSHGVAVLAVATPPAPGLAQTPNTPDLPLADAEPTPPRDQRPPAITNTADERSVPPRAHRQPAAGRAPPA